MDGALAELPEQPVVAGALGVGLDPVGVEQQLLPAGPVVPPGAPGGDSQGGPAIRDAKVAEIDVAGPTAVVGDQRVRRAGVTMADDELSSRREIVDLGERA